MPTSTLESATTTSCFVVSLNLPDGSARRLKALGIFEGQELELARRGSPLIVKAAGGKVAIAEDIARQIVVRTDHE